MAETVTVTIHGSEFKLRGDDAKKVRDTASLVDEQMKYVASKSPMQPVSTTAVLTALNMAERLMTEEDRSKKQAADAVRRIDGLNDMMREFLENET